MALTMTQRLLEAAQARNAAKISRLKDPPAGSETRSDIPGDKADNQIRHTYPTVKSNRQIQQTNPTFRQTNPTDKSNIQTDKSNRQIQQTNPTDKPEKPARKIFPAPESNRQIQQTNPTDNQIGTVRPAIKTRSRDRLVTDAQKTLAAYFLQSGPIVATYAVIAGETGIASGTVRCVIAKFLAHGWLEKTPWGAGCHRALYLAPTPELAMVASQNPTGKSGKKTPQKNPTDKSNRQIQQTNPTDKSNRQNAPLKIDRKNLSISLKTVHTVWPLLAQAGFGLEQLVQIESALAEQGKTTERVIQGLDHAEWELATGAMRDKEGRPVADPCAWVYRCLAGQGYYRRPVGYVSPKEQAERDAAEEARALARSRENARQERFSAWVRGLDAKERKNALEGKIGGSDEAWLKNVWKKRGEPR